MALATIANGASLSGAVDLGIKDSGHKVVGIVMPAAWTAANLTFQASSDNSTFNDLYDDNGTELNINAAQARAIGLRKDQSDVLGRWRFIKVRSGTTGTPVNQNAARTVEIVTK